jgi:hypothetical protein
LGYNGIAPSLLMRPAALCLSLHRVPAKTSFAGTLEDGTEVTEDTTVSETYTLYAKNLTLDMAAGEGVLPVIEQSRKIIMIQYA